MVTRGSCKYFWKVAERIIFPSHSRTRSLAMRMLRRIRSRAGDAPSLISSSPAIHRPISSSMLLWAWSHWAKFPNRGQSSADSNASLHRRMAFRHLATPNSSPGERYRAAWTRFRHPRISGNPSAGLRPVRISSFSASAVRAIWPAASPLVNTGSMASANSRPVQHWVRSATMARILSYSRVFNTFSSIDAFLSLV